MLSVHGRIIGGDGGVFEEVELMSVGRCGKYSCAAPVNVVLHVVAMFGRCGFYVANGVSKIIESVTCFMLLNPLSSKLLNENVIKLWFDITRQVSLSSSVILDNYSVILSPRANHVPIKIKPNSNALHINYSDNNNLYFSQNQLPENIARVLCDN